MTTKTTPPTNPTSALDDILAWAERIRQRNEAEYRFIAGLQGKPFDAHTIAAIDRELTAPDPGLEKRS